MTRIMRGTPAARRLAAAGRAGSRRRLGAPAASSIARRSAAALCSVSSNSFSGHGARDDPGARVDVGLAVA